MRAARNAGAAARAGLLVVGLLAGIAGCGSGDPPTVEFSSAAGTLSTGPAQYCDITVKDCANHPESVVKLPVPPGQSLRIKVPEEVAAGPWVVAFAYRPADGGAQQSGRSALFLPNQRHDYELVLPAPTDQLLTAQVQQFGGGQPVLDQNGDPAFQIRGSWVLVTS